MSSMNPYLASTIFSLLKIFIPIVLYLFNHYLEETIMGHYFHYLCKFVFQRKREREREFNNNIQY